MWLNLWNNFFVLQVCVIIVIYNIYYVYQQLYKCEHFEAFNLIFNTTKC